MTDKEGNKLSVGDYVEIPNRYIPGLGSFSQGVIGRIDTWPSSDLSVVVLAAKNGMPIPLPCTPSSVKIKKMNRVDSVALDNVRIIFDEMLVAVRQA